MGYQSVDIEEVRSVVEDDDGEMWPLRGPLGGDRLSVTVVELAPGGRGVEYDQTGCDCETVYLAVEGAVDVDCPSRSGVVETLTLEEYEAVRLPPEQPRQLVNRSDERVRAVVATSV